MELSIQENERSAQLIGKRLLCEIPFESDDIESLRQAFLPSGIDPWQFPTLAAIMTVGIGVYFYIEGDFWSGFPRVESSMDRNNWGQKFEKFISNHSSLESFRAIKEDRGHRYVGPILAHGGIPQSCLPDFFKLLTGYGDREQSGRDLIDDLKRESGKLARTAQPVQRFLKYGGEVAEDFVSRILALWQCFERGDMNAKCGLPNRVVIAFSEWWPENRPIQQSHLKRIPRPELRIEPASLGVYLYLPRCDGRPDISSKAHWEALGKRWAVTRSHEIQVVAPSESWKISGVGSTIVIEGLTDIFPAIFFDPISGKLITEPTLRRLPEKVWVLIKSGLLADPPPIYEDEFRPWSGYNLAEFDLSSKTQLHIGGYTFDVRKLFFKCAADPVVLGVLGENDTQVFHSIPEIHWEGKANLTLIKDNKPEGNIDIEASEFSVLLDRPGEYDIELRGALGMSIRKHFMFVPKLNIEPTPNVFWPKTNLIKWQISADDSKIKSGDSVPPISRVGSQLEFVAEYANHEISLCAKVSLLHWRLLLQHDNETDGWSTESISVRLNELKDVNYPRFECTFGSAPDGTKVSLVGKHTHCSLEAKRQRAGRQDSWYVDFRNVRDILELGQSEEFELLIQDQGRELFSGKVLSGYPEWHLQNYQAKWKKDEDSHKITVSWQEFGQPITGRWLVVIPLWRPLEGAVLQHELKQSERSGHNWQPPLADLRPGRYLVKAIHAPWGCNNWIEAKAKCEERIDIYPESWPDEFGRRLETQAVESYLETLLAHWYRPERVPQAPKPPTGLTTDEISRFLKYLNTINEMEPIKIPKDGSGSLRIFCENAQSTTLACAAIEESTLPDIYGRVLPSLEVIKLEGLTKKDQEFISDLAFQYTNIKTAAKKIRLKYAQQQLSGILTAWRLRLNDEIPPADEIIFLCEKFRIFEQQSSVHKKRAYEQLKAEYYLREAI